MTEPRNTMPTELTQEKLGEIRERAEKATPGPWDWTPGEWEKVDGVEQQITGAFLTPYETGIDCGEFMAVRDNDAEFMASSRTDIPALLDHIATLTAERDREALGENIPPDDKGRKDWYEPEPDSVQLSEFGLAVVWRNGSRELSALVSIQDIRLQRYEHVEGSPSEHSIQQCIASEEFFEANFDWLNGK